MIRKIIHYCGIGIIVSVSLGMMISSSQAEEQTVTYRVLGLCLPERQDELREKFKEVANVQLVTIDYDKAECTLRYDLATMFPGFNPKKPPTAENVFSYVLDRLNGASRGLLKVKPLGTLSKDQLQRVDIKITTLDCKGCRLGAYFTIAEIEGVEQANISTDPSQITAWIDTYKTKRETLVEALKKAGVEFPPATNN